MNKILIEIVTSPEDLKPGDVVIYGTVNGLRTAKVEKKPTLGTKYSIRYFKPTRCLVSNEIRKVNSNKWDVKTRFYLPVVLEYNIQIFDLENFNRVKYITFHPDSPIIRIINQ